MVTAGLPLGQHWGTAEARLTEIFEAQGKHKVICHHVVAYLVRRATHKLAPSAREMGWMQLSHLFSLSIQLIPQAPTCFPACSSFCDAGILFTFGEFQFLNSCELCLLLLLHSQLSLFLESFYTCTCYFANLLLKPLLLFSIKAGPPALWLQGIVFDFSCTVLMLLLRTLLDFVLLFCHFRNGLYL